MVLNSDFSTQTANCQPTEGARFEVHLTKARGVFGEGAQPFEAKLETKEGVASWKTSEIIDPELLQVMELTDANMSLHEIASELGISKSQVQQLQAKGKGLIDKNEVPL